MIARTPIRPAIHPATLVFGFSAPEVEVALADPDPPVVVAEDPVTEASAVVAVMVQVVFICADHVMVAPLSGEVKDPELSVKLWVPEVGRSSAL